MPFRDIEHVIILMQENISYDQYFGTLPGTENFASPEAQALLAGQHAQPGQDPNPPGPDTAPYHFQISGVDTVTDNGAAHDWYVQHGQGVPPWGVSLTPGQATTVMAGWQAAQASEDAGNAYLGYYTAADVPEYFALASNFTVCDHFFCSVLGGTVPNRLYLMTGSINPSGTDGGPVTVNPALEEIPTGYPKMPIIPNAAELSKDESDQEFSYGTPGTWTWSTYPDRLNAADPPVSWAVYEESPEYGTLNVLVYFANWCDPHWQEGDPARLIDSWRIPPYTPADPPSSGEAPDSYTAADPAPDWTNVGGWRNARSAAPSTFEVDLQQGTLPTVSWLIPPYWTGKSEWPGGMQLDTDSSTSDEDYSVREGVTWMLDKVNAFLGSPYWDNTVFIVTRDENGGAFDHVSPPQPEPGTAGEFVGADPIGLGFRIPCVIISKYSTGGFVCVEQFDHTSVLQFLELVTDVACPAISDWRRGVAGDLTLSFFDGEGSATPPVIDQRVVDAYATLAAADGEVPAGSWPPPLGSTPLKNGCGIAVGDFITTLINLISGRSG
jgi:phospholipase C